MTYLEVVFRYGAVPGENEMRAIDSMREVYGIRRVQFNAKQRTVRVEFDASRLKQDAVAKLLRQAGIDVREPVRWPEQQVGSCQKRTTVRPGLPFGLRKGEGWRLRLEKKARGAHRKPLAEVIL